MIYITEVDLKQKTLKYITVKIYFIKKTIDQIRFVFLSKRICAPLDLKKKLYGPFLWMGLNCLKARATSRRQFTFLIWATTFFLEVSALLDVRHCPKLQSCAISWKTNDANLRKWGKP